jgi:PAS domain S-box-containing protein
MPEHQLSDQIREANERLVVATVRAEQLAEEAELARAAAADNEERFRSLVAASSAIVFRATPDGTVMFEPDAWRAFTGMSPHDDAWLTAVHADDRNRVADLWRSAIASASMYICEHRIRRASNDFAWVCARAVPIIRDGATREWIGMMTDITERVALERAREEFMAVLGHDLRSPLSAISLGATLLQRLALDPPYGGVVDEICSSSRRMTGLIHDLMDLARGRLGGGIPVQRCACDLGKICSQIVAEMMRAHPLRQIGMLTHGDCTGEWDPARMAQVLTNLIGNALAHGTDPIAVALVSTGEDVLAVVTNRGPTIPRDIRATLFQPFAGAHKTSVSKSGGLGLGLYIVNEIVRAHRGVIDVESQDGLTTFTIRLPRKS